MNPLTLKYQPGHAMSVLFNSSENNITIIESPGAVGAINSEPDTVKRLLTFPVRRHVSMECHSFNSAELDRFKEILKKEKKYLDNMTFRFHDLWRNCVHLSNYLYQKVTGKYLRTRGISSLGIVASPDELYWTFKGKSLNSKPNKKVNFYVKDGDVMQFFIKKISSMELNQKQQEFYDAHIKEAQENLKMLQNSKFKAIDDLKQDNRILLNLIELIYFDIIKL